MTMKKVEVKFSEAGNEIVVVVDGLRIAKRGRPGTPHRPPATSARILSSRMHDIHVR